MKDFCILLFFLYFFGSFFVYYIFFVDYLYFFGKIQKKCRKNTNNLQIGGRLLEITGIRETFS